MAMGEDPTRGIDPAPARSGTTPPRPSIRAPARSATTPRAGPGTRVLGADDPDDRPTALHGAPGGPDDPDDPDDGDAASRPTPWRRYGVLAATALLIFLIAMLAITGIERVKGSPLSGGDGPGTSVGRCSAPRSPDVDVGAGDRATATPGESTATTSEDPRRAPVGSARDDRDHHLAAPTAGAQRSAAG